MAQPLRLSTPPPPPALDLAAIKSRQQSTWASGDFAVVATLIHAAAERLVESADLQAGWRVLDVATGSGNAALAAARCGCQVTGVDYVPQLLERGRQRAAAEGLAVEFRAGDAESLPFPGAAFDAVLSIYGVMFAADQERAASELLRVLRPGGRLALANWTPEGFVGDMLRVVTKFAPPPPGLKPSVRWGTEEGLRELFADSLAALEVRRREFVFRFRSPRDFVEVFRRFYGPTLKAFEAAGPERAPQLATELEALARAWNRNAGEPIAIPGEYLEVVATRR